MYKIPKRKDGTVKLSEKDKKAIIKQTKKQIFNDVRKDVEKQAFITMLAIPSMVITDHFEELIDEKKDGLTRAERMADLCIYQYQCIQSGNVTITDMLEYLKSIGIHIN